MKVDKIVKMHKTLADTTRWEIFNMIWQHPGISGKELLSHFHITQPTLSFHLTKLFNGELITVKKVGQSHLYWANVDLLEQMLKYGWQALTINKKTR